MEILDFLKQLFFILLCLMGIIFVLFTTISMINSFVTNFKRTKTKIILSDKINEAIDEVCETLKDELKK